MGRGGRGWELGEGALDITKAYLPKNKTNLNESKSKQQKGRVLMTMFDHQDSAKFA